MIDVAKILKRLDKLQLEYNEEEKYISLSAVNDIQQFFTLTNILKNISKYTTIDIKLKIDKYLDKYIDNNAKLLNYDDCVVHISNIQDINVLRVLFFYISFYKNDKIYYVNSGSLDCKEIDSIMEEYQMDRYQVIINNLRRNI